MTRKLNVLFFAAMALTAFAAITASAAQATTMFTNPNGGETLLKTTPDGTGTTAHHVLDFPPGSVTCVGVSFAGKTTVTESTTQTMETIECTQGRFLGFGVVFRPNGCDYTFNVNGSVTINCPEGKEIEFEGGGCKVRVPAQGPKTSVTYANSGTEEVTVSMNVTGIEGTAEGCISGNGHFTTGQYTTGNTLLTGESTGGVMKAVRVD